ncbi:UNVERIFIED_CONTAM: Hyaluronan and proteoglycan link protein 1 [Siphonaria sp. JEL0065]|nr:Hyaluronan and proteoglycan link protein 1 [Siphonaria sp. JEL0065]
MAFFDRNGIWRSLLDLKGKKNAHQKTQVSEKRLLSEAAAAARALGQEESVRPTLHGVLAVKIRMASLIKFESLQAKTYALMLTDIENRKYYGYGRIILHDFCQKPGQTNPSNSKCFRYPEMGSNEALPCPSLFTADMKDCVDESLSQIVRNRKHPYNLVKIELFGFSPSSMTDIASIGSVSFHLHDILRANPIAGTYDLWKENIQVGDIDLEFTHSYGSFGYGYSPQLKEEDMSPEEIITYSLFPRVIPSRGKCEPDNPVMVVTATPHPPIIPFKECVFLSYGREIRETLEEAADTMYEPTLFEKEMGEFDLIRDEYYSTTNRFARLTFLRNYLKGSTNQEEITVSLQDDTNLEGDTQHRVLISKDYTKFISPDSIFGKDREGGTGGAGGLTVPTLSPGGLMVPGTSPVTISPPTGPLPAVRGTLQAAVDAKRLNVTSSWASGLQQTGGERGSAHSVFLGSPTAEPETDFKGNTLSIPGAWPGSK